MILNLYRTITALIILTSTAYAEIYKGYDQQGRAYFSDRPIKGSELLTLKPVGFTWYTVSKVYDGDTVTLSSGLKVRLASINTPEIQGRSKNLEAGGNEAKIALRMKILGKKVRLVQDIEKKDKYGRTLAHIFNHDQQHINLQMVSEGLAIVNIHPPNLKFAQALLQAQQKAERQRLGFWQYPEYQPKNINTLATNPQRGWQRLVGKVKKTQFKRKFVYLDFSGLASVRIDKQNLDLFPPVQDYIGKQIEIRGWPSRRQKHYSILIRHPSAIKVLESADAP